VGFSGGVAGKNLAYRVDDISADGVVPWVKAKKRKKKGQGPRKRVSRKKKKSRGKTHGDAAIGGGGWYHGQ